MYFLPILLAGFVVSGFGYVDVNGNDGGKFAVRVARNSDDQHPRISRSLRSDNYDQVQDSMNDAAAGNSLSSLGIDSIRVKRSDSGQQLDPTPPYKARDSRVQTDPTPPYRVGQRGRELDATPPWRYMKDDSAQLQISPSRLNRLRIELQRYKFRQQQNAKSRRVVNEGASHRDDPLPLTFVDGLPPGLAEGMIRHRVKHSHKKSKKQQPAKPEDVKSEEVEDPKTSSQIVNSEEVPNTAEESTELTTNDADLHDETEPEQEVDAETADQPSEDRQTLDAPAASQPASVRHRLRLLHNSLRQRDPNGDLEPPPVRKDAQDTTTAEQVPDADHDAPADTSSGEVKHHHHHHHKKHKQPKDQTEDSTTEEAQPVTEQNEEPKTRSHHGNRRPPDEVPMIVDPNQEPLNKDNIPTIDAQVPQIYSPWEAGYYGPENIVPAPSSRSRHTKKGKTASKRPIAVEPAPSVDYEEKESYSDSKDSADDAVSCDPTTDYSDDLFGESSGPCANSAEADQSTYDDDDVAQTSSDHGSSGASGEGLEQKRVWTCGDHPPFSSSVSDQDSQNRWEDEQVVNSDPKTSQSGRRQRVNTVKVVLTPARPATDCPCNSDTGYDTYGQEYDMGTPSNYRRQNKDQVVRGVMTRRQAPGGKQLRRLDPPQSLPAQSRRSPYSRGIPPPWPSTTTTTTTENYIEVVDSHRRGC